MQILYLRELVKVMSPSEVPLSTTVLGIPLKTPLIMASGTWGDGTEITDQSVLQFVGALVTKGLSLEPREGNPPPRLVETACGLINSVGLENVGLKNFIETIIPALSKLEIPVIVNIAPHSVSELKEILTRLNNIDIIKAYEINVSCPNVEEGGISFIQNHKTFSELLNILKNYAEKSCSIKIPPLLFSYRKKVEAILEKGIKTLTVANTYPASWIDVNTERFVLWRKTGGLSGPAIFPITLNLVLLIARDFPEVEIIASGGVYSYDTALQYLLAGARAVQIGSYNFLNPYAVREIAKEILDYLKKKKYHSLEELIGKVKYDGT